MKDLITQWLNSHEEQLCLFEGEDELLLKRQGEAVLLYVQLLPIQPANNRLQHWMRLAAASLVHFQGALAQAPSSGALWLVLKVRLKDGEVHLLQRLETLLNQRDTWRATSARVAPPTPHLKPTSLRSLLY